MLLRPLLLIARQTQKRTAIMSALQAHASRPLSAVRGVHADGPSTSGSSSTSVAAYQRYYKRSMTADPWSALQPVARPARLPPLETLQQLHGARHRPAPPPVPAPDSSPEATAQAVRAQVEFYLGPGNLSRDAFLQQHMQQEGGWVALALLATFPRMQQLLPGAEPAAIAAALLTSSCVELSADMTRVRPLPGAVTQQQQHQGRQQQGRQQQGGQQQGEQQQGGHQRQQHGQQRGQKRRGGGGGGGRGGGRGRGGQGGDDGRSH